MDQDFHIYKDDINTIVTKIFLIVYEYFDLMSESDVMQKSNMKNNIVEIGLNTILHIFKINLLVYKSADVAYLYSQKAYYCYLEYIEQIHNKCITDELNTKDAVLFLYNKTLLKNECTDYIELNHELFKFPKLIDTILQESINIIQFIVNFDNIHFTLHERKHLCETFLLPFLTYFLLDNTINPENMKEIFLYLRTMNEKQMLSYTHYCSLITELFNGRTNINKKINKSNFLKIFNEEFIIDISDKDKNKRFIQNLFY